MQQNSLAYQNARGAFSFSGLLTSGLDANGQFRLLVSGDAGPDYTVQTSTNLRDWTTLLTRNQPSLPFLLVETDHTNYPARFYRAVLGP